MTTPLLNLATFASPIWPVLRYLHVFSGGPDLRLIADWAEVDFHQKALTSDDLGVGFATEVLQNLFNYTHFADGVSFLRRLYQLGFVAAGPVQPPKKGPRKSPDYIFLTPSGRLHIVECKGSQSDRKSLNQAMTIGVGQKHSFAFANPAHEARYVAQRLVTGLHLRREGQSGRSTLIVRDPAPSEPFTISREVRRKDLRESLRRNHFARLLMSCGFVETARLVGLVDREGSEEPLGSELSEALHDTIEVDRSGLESWTDERGSWLGQRIDVPIPWSVASDNPLLGRARMDCGIRKDAIERLRHPSKRKSRYFAQQFPELSRRLRVSSFSREGNSAEIFSPELFIAQIKLGTAPMIDTQLS